MIVKPYAHARPVLSYGTWARAVHDVREQNFHVHDTVKVAIHGGHLILFIIEDASNRSIECCLQ